VQLPKTTSEQRATIYDDVKSLVTPGFLAHSVEVGEARFSLRSLDQADWFLLTHRAQGLFDKAWQSWAVASSVWMVNGMVVMGDEEALYEIHEMCRRMPRTVVETLYSILNGLMRRVSAAAEIAEAFLYEDESRSLWRSEGPPILDRNVVGRVARFFNPVISLWTFYNQMEDKREHDEHDWAIAKFVVGPHAPKGIKKISAKDKQRDTDLRKRREDVMHRAYYEATGAIPKSRDEKDKVRSKRRFQDVVMAETNEELQDVMRRWVDGKKDDHDRVVDGVKAKIKHDVETRHEQARQRRVAMAKALEEEGVIGTRMVPLTGDAGRKFIERMKARMPGTSRVVDDHTHNSAYEKYIKNNPEVGDLWVDENGNVMSERASTPEMLEVMRKPLNVEGESLQHKIEQRRMTAPSFEEGEED